MSVDFGIHGVGVGEHPWNQSLVGDCIHLFVDILFTWTGRSLWIKVSLEIQHIISLTC